MISFVIPGVPVPQGRPRVYQNGGVGYNRSTTAYRKVITQYAEIAKEEQGQLFGALAMMCEFTFPIPTRWPKHRQQAAMHGMWHITRKDVDNLCKAIADSCNGILYEDDEQIAVLIGTKSYSTEPEARVTICQLNDIQNPRWLIGNLKRQLAGCEV